MKKTFLALLLIICCGFSINAYASVEKGDYISFGNYNSESIIWRIVEEDSESYLLLSDKILCLKPFDEQLGRWSESQLREWLNSVEPSNAFYNESGFLSQENFTAEEYEILYDTLHSPIISAGYASESDSGNEEHIYSIDVTQSSSNGAVAFRENVVDKIFIPSVDYMNVLRRDVENFGVEYNMTYMGDMIKNYPYWLCDSLGSDSLENNVRVMSADNKISLSKADNESIGIRPMCRLKKGAFNFSEGNGKIETPYVVSAGEGIFISTNPYALKGDVIEISLLSSFSSDVQIEKYLNGSKVEGDIVAQLGENVIEYVAVKNEQVVAVSNKLVVNGINYMKLKSVLEENFENITEDEMFSQFRQATVTGGAASLQITDDTHKTSLLLESSSGKKVFASFRDFDKENIAGTEFDFMIEDTSILANTPAFFKISPEGTWISPVSIKDGVLTLNEVSTVLATPEIKNGQWYTIGIYFDQYKNTITVYLKECGAESGEFVCIDSPLARGDFDYIMYGEITSTPSSLSTENKIYFDNISVWSGIADADIIYTTEREVENAKAYIKIVNPLGTANSVNVFFAEYVDDQLINAYIEPVTFEEGEYVKTSSYDLGENTETRIFVFDKNLKPY